MVLIEEGTHNELLAMGGHYKALYDTYYAHQSAEEISEEILKSAQEELAKEEIQPKQPPEPEMKKQIKRR